MQLDNKHDKHERLVKLSRDCTIQSKRTIFLLHRKHNSSKAKDNNSDQTFDKIIDEAEGKLFEAVLILKKISAELMNELDPLKYHSAYTHGVQEFLEALSFYIFQKESRLLSYEEAKDWLTFAGNDKHAIGRRFAETVKTQSTVEAAAVSPFPLSAIDYVLGLADLTGEMMRLCVNAAGSGDLELPFFIVKVLQDVYCSYIALTGLGLRELPRKMQTLKNSLRKIENVCYNIKVRGSELPNQMLVDMLTRSSEADTQD